MIRGKDRPSLYRDAPSSSASEEAASPPAITYSGVLQDLFRARQEQDMGNRMSDSRISLAAGTGSNHNHQLTNIPLMADTMVGSSPLFCRNRYAVNQVPGWKSTSLVEQLGLERIIPDPASAPSPASIFSILEDADKSFSNSRINSNNHKGPLTGDKELDQTIRSFSATAAMARGPTAMHNRTKRTRQFATRYRLVHQAIGQKGAQKVVALVKEIQQLRTSLSSYQEEEKPKPVRDILNNKTIVDAWENTPLDDLKSLDWEDLIQKGQECVGAYRAWQ